MFVTTMTNTNINVDQKQIFTTEKKNILKQITATKKITIFIHLFN